MSHETAMACDNEKFLVVEVKLVLQRYPNNNSFPRVGTLNFQHYI